MALVPSKASGTLTLNAVPVAAVEDMVGADGTIVTGGGKAARIFAGGGWGTGEGADGGATGLGESAGLGAAEGSGVS